MRVSVRAKPGARRATVTRLEDIRVNGGAQAHFAVAVRERALDGAANAAIVAALAAHLGVPRASVRIIRGATARDKLVEIEER